MKQILAFVETEAQVALLKQRFAEGAFRDNSVTIAHLRSAGEIRSDRPKLREVFLLNCKEAETIEHDILDWFHHWAVSQHAWGDVRSQLLYRDVSLWYFIQAWFSGSYLLIDFTFRHILKCIGLAQVAFKKFSPDQVLIVDDGGTTARIIALVARGHGMPVQRLFLGSSLRREIRVWHRRLWPTMMELLKLAKSLTRWIWFKPIRRQAYPHGPIWMLSMSIGINQFETLPKGGKRYRDYLVGTLIDAVTSKYGQEQVAVIEFDITADLAWDRLRWMKPPYYPFELFSGPAEILRSWRIAAPFRRRCKALMEKETFQQSFTFRGVPLWELVMPMWKVLLRWRIPEAIRYLNSLDPIVEELRPSLVMVSDELSRFSCALVTAAHRRRIPTICLQHGLFYVDPMYPGFVPALDDRWGGDDAGIRYVPQADYYAAYGEAAKRHIMRKQAYPNDRILKVGCPRYDELIHHASHFNHDAFRSKLGVPPNSKVVLFTSSLYLSDDAVRIVLQGMRQIRGIVPLVRAHPRERDQGIDQGRYERLARDVGLQIRLVSSLKLTDLLYFCDVVVTAPSTVAAEAALIGKPVVLITHGLPVSYYQYANGLPMAFTADELCRVVGDALSGDVKIADLKGFVDDTFANCEGTATSVMLTEMEKIALSREASA